jgi:hypothetical protein
MFSSMIFRSHFISRWTRESTCHVSKIYMQFLGSFHDYFTKLDDYFTKLDLEDVTV